MSMIRVDKEGAIRTVTLTRPAKRNAMNLEMLAALEEAFSEIPSKEERVVDCGKVNVTAAEVAQKERDREEKNEKAAKGKGDGKGTDDGPK